MAGYLRQLIARLRPATHHRPATPVARISRADYLRQHRAAKYSDRAWQITNAAGTTIARIEA